MLPAELDELRGRSDLPDGLPEMIRDYASSYSDEWGGYVADNRGGITAFVTSHEGDHQRRLTALLGGVPVSVKKVEYAVVGLNALAADLETDAALLPAVGAMLFGVDVLETENAVRLSFTGRRDAEPVVRTLLGNPNWLRVRWVDTGWAGEVGSAEVRAGAPGADYARVECRASAADGSPVFPIEVQASPDGVCAFQALPALRMRFDVLGVKLDADEATLLGTVTATVQAGELTTVTLRIP